MKFIQSPVFAAILGGVLFLLTSAFLNAVIANVQVATLM